MTRALHLTPTPAADVAYPQGSIVLCRQCNRPIYRLQRSIYIGEPVGKSAWKYAPVSVRDIEGLMARGDLEPGQRAFLRAVPLADWQTHCSAIPTLKAGDFMDCPSCRQQFSYGVAPDSDDGASMFADRGYRVVLAIIPPPGQGRRAS